MNPATLPERKEHRNPVLERLIDQRTFGRVRGLRVNQTDSRVIVHGQAHSYYVVQLDRKSTRLNSSHIQKSRMPSSA